MILPIGILFGNLRRRTVLVQIHILLHTFSIEHMTHLTTAIDLVDLSTFFQVHLRIFRPSVDTVTCSVNSSQQTFIIFLPYRRRDIHLGIERTSLVVVAAIDGITNGGITTTVVHIRLIHVTRRQNLRTISATEDFFDINGGCCRHIDDGTGRYTLVIATAIDRLDLALHQVYNGRQLVGIKRLFKGFRLVEAHA